MRRFPRAILLLILPAALLAALPAVLQANRELAEARRLAEIAPLDSAVHYEAAARWMFWRRDLWEQAGRSAFRGGDNSAAVRLLETALDRNSLSAPGWDELGQAHWARGDHARALATWQQAAQVYPASPDLYDHLAMADHEIGNYALEEAALTQRLKLEEDASARYRLGLLLASSDPDRALGELLAASVQDAQFDPAVQTMRTTINLASLEPSEAGRMLTIGRGLGLVSEWPLAARSFAQAVQADPRNAEAWAWLGEARQHLAQGGFDELEKALALDRNSTIVRALRGLYFTRLGDHTAALTEYLQAAQIEPDNPAWQASAGESYARTGDLIAALAAYRRAAELAPQEATYWRLLAGFCVHNDVQVLEVGLPAAKKSAELAPDDVQSLDVLGLAYTSAGLLFNAEETLKKAIELAPWYAPAHLHLAETYLRKGDSNAALSELNLARDLDPDGPTGQLAVQMLQQYFP
jgi:tetratricopeptide (TPR) repeat protein